MYVVIADLFIHLTHTHLGITLGRSCDNVAESLIDRWNKTYGFKFPDILPASSWGFGFENHGEMCRNTVSACNCSTYVLVLARLGWIERFEPIRSVYICRTSARIPPRGTVSGSRGKGGSIACPALAPEGRIIACPRELSACMLICLLNFGSVVSLLYTFTSRLHRGSGVAPVIVYSSVCNDSVLYV